MTKYYIIVGRDIRVTGDFETIQDAIDCVIEMCQLNDIKEREKSDSMIRFNAIHENVPTACCVCEEKHIDLEGWQEALNEQYHKEYFEYHRDFFERDC